MSKIDITNSDPVDRRRSSSALWLARLRAIEGYDVALRSLGSGWFLLLALVFIRKAIGLVADMNIINFRPLEWSELASSICLVLFYLSLWWLMVIRPAPKARTDGLLPSLIAFAGGYLPWTIPMLAPASVSANRNFLSAALVSIGATLMVVAIFHLGRSFSIVPQARSLVRTGPYAVVRNPLYLAEEVAILGVLLQYFSPVTLLIFLIHGALQVRRVFYEEKLLQSVFIDYHDYARSTFRMIPYVW